jgi:hypothetical protein
MCAVCIAGDESVWEWKILHFFPIVKKLPLNQKMFIIDTGFRMMLRR